VRCDSEDLESTMFARLGIPMLLILASPDVIHGQQPPSVSELLRQFQVETVFWRQMEVARKIVAANNASVIPALEPWLTHEDRHLRGNAAFVYAGLGDPRGFEVITAILRDHSERPEGQGIPDGTWSFKRKSLLTVTTPRISLVT